MEKSKIDITKNAVWTRDCCGKQDLDFGIIDAYTRYWPDYSAQCSIVLRPEFNWSTGDYPERGGEYTLIESEIMRCKSEKSIKAKVRRWYNTHIIAALHKAIDIIENEDEKNAQW